MNKIRVGIFGYGNLGKALEDLLAKDDRFELVAIFSRRAIKSKHKTPTEFCSRLNQYENKIDIMFLCGGSSSDLMPQAQECLKFFNCIDAFDTHAKIDEHIFACNQIAMNNNKVAFCSLGWDPGLFSLMRVLFNSFGYTTFCAWGKGVSQGHTEAIKCLSGVVDAVQYTIPNKSIIKKLKQSKLTTLANANDMHIRDCYVCANPIYHNQIKQSILTMPNYFEGYKTKVNFVSQSQIEKHKKMYHAGEVFCVGDEVNFKIKVDSNPHFTARILIAYAIVLNKFVAKQRFGAYSILDIPPKYLIENAKGLI